MKIQHNATPLHELILEKSFNTRKEYHLLQKAITSIDQNDFISKVNFPFYIDDY